MSDKLLRRNRKGKPVQINAPDSRARRRISAELDAQEKTIACEASAFESKNEAEIANLVDEAFCESVKGTHKSFAFNAAFQPTIIGGRLVKEGT